MNRRNVIPTFILGVVYLVESQVVQAFQVKTPLQLATVGLFVISGIAMLYQFTYHATGVVGIFRETIKVITCLSFVQAGAEFVWGLIEIDKIPFSASLAGLVGGGITIAVAYTISQINPDLNPFPSPKAEK